MRRGAGGSHGLPPPELAAQVAPRSPARRRWRPSAVRFLTLFTAGCFAIATTGAAAADAPARVATGDLNVVFVILDAAGATHFSTYGLQRDTAPRITALAREGTLFRRAYAQSAWTLPSTASFLTGRYPPRRASKRMRVLGDTLATRLHDAGFATAGFSENAFVTGDFGFTRGFDKFNEYYPWKRHLEQRDSYSRADTGKTVDDIVAWIRDVKQKRFFVYAHLLPPHSPYDPPPPFGGRFDPDYRGSVEGSIQNLLKIESGSLAVDARDLEHLRLQYEDNLAFADDQVGRLLDALDALGLGERTIVIVASDHGEAFREHGHMLHTYTLYDEMIRVPLVIRFPARYGAPHEPWPDVVETRAILPTVCDALAIGPCADRSRSLLELVRRGTGGPAGVAISRTIDTKNRPLAAVVSGSYKLIVGNRIGAVELYDLEHDPDERTNLAGHDRPRVLAMKALLRAADAESTPLSEGKIRDETRRNLEALGYVQQ